MKPILFFIFANVFVLISCTRTVIIGDSLFWSGMLFGGGEPSPLSKWLETWSNHPIENYAKVGASVEPGWVKSIPDQYNSINKNSPNNITTIIMDGGGNDVMSHRNDCEKWNEPCRQVLNKNIHEIEILFQQFKDDGIQNVIYLGAYYLSGLEKAIDYGNSQLSLICNNASIPCHFVDPRYNETNHHGLQTPEMLGSDGIHPNNDGYKILAEMIYDTAIEYHIIL